MTIITNKLIKECIIKSSLLNNFELNGQELYWITVATEILMEKLSTTVTI